MTYAYYKFRGDRKELLNEERYNKIVATIQSMDRMNQDEYNNKCQVWQVMMKQVVAIWGNGSKEWKRIKNVPLLAPKKQATELKRIAKLRDEQLRLAGNREYAADYRRRVAEAIEFLESRGYIRGADFHRGNALTVAKKVRETLEFRSLEVVP